MSVPLYVLLKDRKENSFLVLEIVVKSASRFPDIRCDVFQAGMFEAVARENLSGRKKKLLSRNQSTLLLVESGIRLPGVFF